jgi:NADH-quinone oxidoreductase subunit J
VTPVVAVTHATIPDIITFVVCAAMVLSGAVGVVSSRNPVHAALSLVLTLFGIAVLFVEQDADFLAAVQVIVYAGAIVVLFLFVIMFLGVDRRENVEAEPLRGQRPLALLLVLISIGGVIALAVSSRWVTGAHTVTLAAHGPKGEVGQLGKSVFTTYLFAFEVTAALLVIAVVGAVVLARRPPTPVPDESEQALDTGDPAGAEGDPGGDELGTDEPAEPATAADAGAAVAGPGAGAETSGPDEADHPAVEPVGSEVVEEVAR